MNEIQVHGLFRTQKKFKFGWVIRILVLVTFGICLVSVVQGVYFLGKLNGALDPLRSYEVPMCVAYDTQIRTGPSGYILGDVPAGAMVWFTKLELPFAYVSFYDGDAWLEGTVTATAIEVCK